MFGSSRLLSLCNIRNDDPSMFNKLFSKVAHKLIGSCSSSNATTLPWHLPKQHRRVRKLWTARMPRGRGKQPRLSHSHALPGDAGIPQPGDWRLCGDVFAGLGSTSPRLQHVTAITALDQQKIARLRMKRCTRMDLALRNSGCPQTKAPRNPPACPADGHSPHCTCACATVSEG